MATPSKEHVRYHENPRMSANDLARFIATRSPVVQMSIIRNAREAKSAPVSRYKHARVAVTGFLTHPHRDAKILHGMEHMLQQKKEDPTSSPYVVSDAALSIEVLHATQSMSNKLNVIDFQPAPKDQLPLKIEGVEVSVYLNALVHAETKKKSLIGGALFRFTKADNDETDLETEDRQKMGTYSATLAYLHVLEHFKGTNGREPSPAHCLSIDFRHGDVHTSSQSIARRVDNIKTACKMINGLWKVA